MLWLTPLFMQFYGACLKTEGAIMILEYMAGGDLMEAIAQDKNGELKWMRRGHLIALDVARALVFLHRNKVGRVIDARGFGAPQAAESGWCLSVPLAVAQAVLVLHRTKVRQPAPVTKSAIWL